MRTVEALILYAVFALGVGQLYTPLHLVLRDLPVPEFWASLALAVACAVVVWSLNGAKLLAVSERGLSGWSGNPVPVIAGMVVMLVLLGAGIRWFDPAYDYWLLAEHRLNSPRGLYVFLLTLPAWAFAEEVVFRNIQVRVADQTGRLLGIVAVALAFGFYHVVWQGVWTPHHAAEIVGTVAGGIAFALIFEARRSLWLTWFVHALYNVLATLDVTAHVQGRVGLEIVSATVLLLAACFLVAAHGSALPRFARWLTRSPHESRGSRAVPVSVAIVVGAALPFIVVGIRALG